MSAHKIQDVCLNLMLQAHPARPRKHNHTRCEILPEDYNRKLQYSMKRYDNFLKEFMYRDNKRKMRIFDCVQT